VASYEFGVRTTDALLDMEDAIKQVYLPALQQRFGMAKKPASASKVKAGPTAAAAAAAATTEDDGLVASVQRFGLVLNQEILCRRGQLRLKLPAAKPGKTKGPASFAEMAEMESCVEDWLREVGAFLQAENLKAVPGSAGPLAEISYWRDRNVALSGVHEQLQAPAVSALLRRLVHQDSAGLAGEFNGLAGEVFKLHAEAKDNVKFLSTLERHFRVVHHGSFGQVKEALPSMLNAIRMVWIVSRNFNTDEKLVPLMERVAGEMARRVTASVKVGTILDLGEGVAAAQIEAAAALLVEWENAYNVVRERINGATSSGQPWEFDRRRLFGKSRYMATVCGDLEEVVATVEQFLRFLSPEVKAIVGKRAEEVDDMLGAVAELKEPFSELTFDIFDRAFKESWVATMDQFRLRVVDIEEMCKKFIETAFQELRSAEGAFDFVSSFESIKSRGPINAHIAARYQDILVRFKEELGQLEELFRLGRGNPPRVKDFPPVAGAIAWATGLYKRAKRTILKFRSRAGLLESPFGEKVKAKYLTFARAVDAYVQTLYEGWAAKAADAVVKLKEPLLVSIAPPVPSGGGGGHGSHGHSHARAQGVPLPQTPYAVNFGGGGGAGAGAGGAAVRSGASLASGGLPSVGGASGGGKATGGVGAKASAAGGAGGGGDPGASVLDIISESRSLDAMGFVVPQAAVSVTLQAAQLRLHALGLETMLKRLHATLAGLTPVEERLLAIHKKDLLTTLLPGFTSYNWTSQRIPAFTAAANTAITVFESALDAVHAHGASMEGILDRISRTALFTVADLEEKVRACASTLPFEEEWFLLLSTRSSWGKRISPQHVPAPVCVLVCVCACVCVCV